MLVVGLAGHLSSLWKLKLEQKHAFWELTLRERTRRGQASQSEATAVGWVPAPFLYPELLSWFLSVSPLVYQLKVGGRQLMGMSRWYSVTQAVNDRQVLPTIHAVESGEFSPKKITSTPPICFWSTLSLRMWPLFGVGLSTNSYVTWLACLDPFSVKVCPLPFILVTD